MVSNCLSTIFLSLTSVCSFVWCLFQDWTFTKANQLKHENLCLAVNIGRVNEVVRFQPCLEHHPNQVSRSGKSMSRDHFARFPNVFYFYFYFAIPSTFSPTLVSSYNPTYSTTTYKKVARCVISCVEIHVHVQKWSKMVCSRSTHKRGLTFRAKALRQREPRKYIPTLIPTSTY